MKTQKNKITIKAAAAAIAETADALADEERQLIATDAEPEKLRATRVEWNAGVGAE